MTRLVRVVRARWRVAAVIGAVCMIAAVIATIFVNQNPLFRYEAVAAIQFTPEDGQPIDSFEAEVQDAFDAARLAVAPLPVDGSQQVVYEAELAQIQFVAEAGSATEARAAAEGLRETYLLRDPRVGGDVDVQLATLEQEADEVRVALDELRGDPAPELAEQHAFLNAQIDAVDARLVLLPAALAGAIDGETQQALQAERTRLESTRASLVEQLAALPPLPEPPTPSDELEIAALEARLATVTAQYEQVFLRKLGVTGLGVSEPVRVEDLTLGAISPWMTGLAGLVLGLLLGVAALMFADRARRSVWLAEDLPVPLLAQIPPRRPDADAHGVWYDQPTRGPRKPTIQLLRSTVEAEVGEGSAIAIGGTGVDADALGELGEDLGAALAVAGRSVAVVHTDFAASTTTGPSLAPLWTSEFADPTSATAEVLAAAEPARAGLTIIAAGPPPASPADALAGRSFREFLAAASSRFDVVVLVVGDAADPAAQVAIQRAGRLVLALAPGETSVSEVEALLSDLVQRQTRVLGSVFLEARDRFVTDAAAPSGPVGAGPRPRPDAPSTGGGVALERPPMARSSTFTDLRGGKEVLSAIEGARSQAALDVVGDYLIGRIEHILRGDGVDEESLLADVSRDGFVPIQPFDGRPTAGQWLAAELVDADPEVGTAVAKAVRRVLDSDADVDASIDDWLCENFFDIHLARHGGTPSVVHLRSDRGTIQVLVSLRRLDRDLIRALGFDYTAPLVEACEAADDDESAKVLAELRRFRQQMFELAAPSSGGDTAWDPDRLTGAPGELEPLRERGVLAPSQLLRGESLSSAG